MILLFAALSLCACNAITRAPLPVEQAKAARLPGYTGIRTWGDRAEPDLPGLVALQHAQVRAHARTQPDARRTLAEAHYLAISGGGGDGAYAAGFLKGWSASGRRPRFEVVTGVSTGALAAPFALLGSAYDDVLEAVYTQHSDADIYTEQGLLGLLGSAIGDNAPLKRLIESYVDEPFLDAVAAEYGKGRRLLVLTTNLDAQRPVIWDLTAVAASGQPDRRRIFVQTLLASAAIPAIFPPVPIEVVADGDRRFDELHVDGGVSAQVFFVPPHLRLNEIEQRSFGRLRQRTLYVIRNGKLVPEHRTIEPRTLAIAGRAVSTLIKVQSMADLARLERGALENHGRIRITAIPERFSAQSRSEFDPIYMRALFEEGYSAGLAQSWRASQDRTTQAP